LRVNQSLVSDKSVSIGYGGHIPPMYIWEICKLQTYCLQVRIVIALNHQQREQTAQIEHFNSRVMVGNIH
jgi:hypothetical protein